MTTHRKYTCNLCRDEITIDPATGIGVYFALGTRYIEFLAIDKVENHICTQCLTAVHAQADEALKKLSGK